MDRRERQRSAGTPVRLVVAPIALLVGLLLVSGPALAGDGVVRDSDGWRPALGPHGFDIAVSGVIGVPDPFGGVDVTVGVPLTNQRWWRSRLSVLIDVGLGLHSDRTAGYTALPLEIGVRTQVWHTRWFAPFISLRAGPVFLLDADPYGHNQMKLAVGGDLGLVFLHKLVGLRLSVGAAGRRWSPAAVLGRIGVIVAL